MSKITLTKIKQIAEAIHTDTNAIVTDTAEMQPKAFLMPVVTSFITPAGAASPNDWSIGTFAMFAVTGVCMVKVFGVVTTAVVSTGHTGTIEVGTGNGTATLIGQLTAGDGTIVAHDIYINTTATHVNKLGIPTTINEGWAVVKDDTIDIKVATAAVVGGRITFYCMWYPISSDGAVVASASSSGLWHL